MTAEKKQRGLQTSNQNLLFDGWDSFLQFPVQVDLSPCAFVGMGYGRFTDPETVPK
jgi:hypothetical protein